MTVYIGNDHGGVELKNAIVDMLAANGYAATDFGTGDTQSVDYPDFAYAVAKAVASDQGSRGIVVCKTGIGVSMCANKVKGIRCALCVNTDMSRLCREHNNANVLALGAGNTDIKTALDIVNVFLTTEFSGGRHATRVDKIMNGEE